MVILASVENEADLWKFSERFSVVGTKSETHGFVGDAGARCAPSHFDGIELRKLNAYEILLLHLGQP